ncbi:unnamed protein product, partial [Allacma fusca]
MRGKSHKIKIGYKLQFLLLMFIVFENLWKMKRNEDLEKRRPHVATASILVGKVFLTVKYAAFCE